MAIRTRTHVYSHGDTTLEALIAWDDAIEGPRPGVLVSHAWRGRSDFENDKARMLAELGYVGFALDLYGQGVLGTSPEENAALMQPFLDDRGMLAERLQCAVQELAELPECDDARMAAIGFCFGGLCVLDLARRNAPLRGVVSFHGLLQPPPDAPTGPIRPAMLIAHGWDDPMAPRAHVEALAAELSARDADWQLHAYGGAAHAFTNPAAADPANGLQYEPRTEQRSLAAMRRFLQEVFEAG